MNAFNFKKFKCYLEKSLKKKIILTKYGVHYIHNQCKIITSSFTVNYNNQGNNRGRSKFPKPSVTIGPSVHSFARSSCLLSEGRHPSVGHRSRTHLSRILKMRTGTYNSCGLNLDFISKLHLYNPWFPHKSLSAGEF